jgi:CIC family chloride channel protein
VESGAFAVVGMAAMFAVVGRAPLTAILMVFEVTGARDYQLILPLMLTATLGTFLAERFHTDSIYSMMLRHMGIKVRKTGEVDLLDTIQVGSVMATSPMVCSPSDGVGEVEEMLHRTRSHGLPVVEGGRLVGVITLSDIARADSGEETVAEAMTHRPATVAPTTPVSTALERMAVLGVGRLPVVAEDDPLRLVGVFRREEAVRAYHEALTANTDMELHRARLAQRTDPGAGYYEFRIPPGSMADGHAIRDVAWPEGSTLVSIRRDRNDRGHGLEAGGCGHRFRDDGLEGAHDRAPQRRRRRAHRRDLARGDRGAGRRGWRRGGVGRFQRRRALVESGSCQAEEGNRWRASHSASSPWS